MKFLRNSIFLLFVSLFFSACSGFESSCASEGDTIPRLGKGISDIPRSEKQKFIESLENITGDY